MNFLLLLRLLLFLLLFQSPLLSLSVSVSAAPPLILTDPSHPASPPIDWDNLGAKDNGNWKDVGVPSSLRNEFCVNDTHRVISDYGLPLYLRPLVLGFLPSEPFAQMWTWVAKILLSEVMGFQVYINDQIDDSGNSPYDWVEYFTSPTYPVDIVITTGLSAEDAEVFQQNFNEFVVQKKAVVSFGEIEADPLRQVVLFSSQVIGKFPTPINYWSAWTQGVKAHGLDIPYNPERAASVMSLVNEFLNASWAGLGPNMSNLFNIPFDPSSGYACPTDDILYPSLGATAGCNDPNYPGMYIPPQCYPHPEQQCALIWGYPPSLQNGILQPLVRELNLSLAVAFLSEIFMLNFTYAPPDDFYGIFGTGTRLPQALQTCSEADGTEAKCWTAMDFPLFSASDCLPLLTGNYSASYYCAPPPTLEYRMGSATLETDFPRVFEFATQFNMDNSDVQSMYTSVNGTSIYQLDYKRIACDWILSHEDKWIPWIPPPAECSSSDYQWALSDCDDSTEKRQITYQWTFPKACQGGVPLPPPSSLHCEYFSGGAAPSQVMTALSAVLSVPFVFLLIFTIFLSSVNFSPSYASSIEFRLQAQKRFLEQNSAKGIIAVSFREEFSAIQKYTVIHFQSLVAFPIVNLMGRWMAFLSIGCVAILAALLFHFNLPEVSNATCWIDSALFLQGISMVTASHAMGTLKFHSICHHRIVGKKEERRLQTLFALSMVGIGILLIVGGSDINLLGEMFIHLDTGAQFIVSQCEVLPSWILVLFGLFNALTLFVSLMVLVRLALLDFSEWLLDIDQQDSRKGGGGGLSSSILSLFASNNTFTATTSNSPLKRKSRKFHAVSKAHSTQRNSLALSLMALIPLTVILFQLEGLNNTTLNIDDLVFIDLYSGYIILSLLFLLFPTLFVLSLRDAIKTREKQRRQKEREKKRLKANAEPKEIAEVKGDKFKFVNKNINQEGEEGEGKGEGERELLGREDGDGDGDENADAEEGPFVNVGVQSSATFPEGIPSPLTAQNFKYSNNSKTFPTETSTHSASKSMMSTSKGAMDPFDEGKELDSLRNVLSDPLCSLLLEQYSETMFDSESIKFLLSCKGFLKLCSMAYLKQVEIQMGGFTSSSSHNVSSDDIPILSSLLCSLIAEISDSPTKGKNSNSPDTMPLAPSSTPTPSEMKFEVMKMSKTKTEKSVMSEKSLVATPMTSISNEYSTLSTQILSSFPPLRACVSQYFSAQSIVQQFILEGSTHQVNVSSTQREEITKAMQKLRKHLHTLIQHTLPVSLPSAIISTESTDSSPWPLGTGKINEILNENFPQSCSLARQIFSSIIPEVYNLLSMNTFSRFLQSDFAARCQEVIYWSYAFNEMNEREQEAMLKRLNKQFKMQRLRGNQDDMASVQL